MLVVFLVMLVAASMQAPITDPSSLMGPQHCDPAYECKYDHFDNKGIRYYYDFSPMCHANGYSHVQSGDTYSYNICGNSNILCNPKFGSLYYYGVAVQSWTPTPDCNPSTMNCTDPTTGQPSCCTNPCEVLGYGIPMFYPENDAMPIQGGVKMTFQGAYRSAGDHNLCPLNPATKQPVPRMVTFNMQCDTSVSKFTGLVLLNLNETAPCHYTFTIASPYACGCVPDCQGKDCGVDGCGGFCGSPQNSGDCPTGYHCLSNSSTCCRTDCFHRDCGHNGCGGSCGTCKSGHTCDQYFRCVETPVASSGGSSIAGAFFGGLFTTVAIGAVGIFVYKRKGTGGFSTAAASSSSSFSATSSSSSSSSAPSTGAAAGTYGSL